MAVEQWIWGIVDVGISLIVGCECLQILVYAGAPGTTPLLIQGWDNCVYNFQCSLSLPVYTSHKLILIFSLKGFFFSISTSLVAQRLKHLPLMRETWVQSLGQEDPLEKEKATHSRILAWRIPWTEEPGGLQSMGFQRVGHN